jgi:hypothetical protein
MNSRHAIVIAKLKAGEVVENFRESGNSMTPLIRHQQPVTLHPVDASKLERGDMVFCKVRGNLYGIVTAVDGVSVGGAMSKVRSNVAP